MDAVPASPIPVFISYSHDSDEHKKQVLALSQWLRVKGIDVSLDQYVNGSPPEGWPRWMLDRIDEARWVLVVCTPTYYQRFRGRGPAGEGRGGDWEGAIIMQEIYDQRSRDLKFIPVQFSDQGQQYIPEPLRSQTCYSLTSQQKYDELYRVLRGMGGVPPAPLGTLGPVAQPVVSPILFADDPVQEEAGSGEPSPADAGKGMGQNAASCPMNTKGKTMVPSKKVYVSYSQQVEKQTEIIKALEPLCPARNIELVYDKTALRHGDSIKAFMDQLASGEHIITILSDAYFKSADCMYELLTTSRRGDFAKRTHAILVDGCKLFDQDCDYRLDLVAYWHQQYQDLNAKVKEHNPADAQGTTEKLERYREIAQNIDKLLTFIADRYTTSLPELRQKHYTQLLDLINPVVAQPVSTPVPKSEKTDTPQPLPNITARIHFPSADFAKLETDVGCRWGLWRHRLLGILSGPDAASLLHVLNKIDGLLIQAKTSPDTCRLPLRHWHIIDAATSYPPNGPSDLPAPIRGNQSELQPGQEAALLGLIVTFTAPEATPLPPRDIQHARLTDQLSQWIPSLFRCFPGKKEPAIICLIQGGTVAELETAARAMTTVVPSGVPVDFLRADPLTIGHDQILEAWYAPPSTDSTQVPAADALRVFIQLLNTGQSTIAAIPSISQLFEAVSVIEGEGDRRIKFWELLNCVKKFRPLLLTPIIYRAACSLDAVLADIALRFAKDNDQLLDAWLAARRGTLPFRPSWLTYTANPAFGGAFLDDLALGLARLVREAPHNSEALGWLQSLIDCVSPPLARTLNTYVLPADPPLPLLTAMGEEEILLAHRSGCLNGICSESFPLDIENPYPFWLLQTRTPTRSWLSHILACPWQKRSVFGLTTSTEQQELDQDALVKTRIGECRRTPLP